MGYLAMRSPLVTAHDICRRGAVRNEAALQKRNTTAIIIGAAKPTLVGL